MHDAASRATAVEAFRVLQDMIQSLLPAPPGVTTSPADQGEVMQNQMPHLIAMVADLHTYLVPS